MNILKSKKLLFSIILVFLLLFILIVGLMNYLQFSVNISNPNIDNPLEINSATLYGTFQTSEHLSTSQADFILDTRLTVDRVESDWFTKNYGQDIINNKNYIPVSLETIFENILDDEYYAEFNTIPSQFLNSVNNKKIKITGRIIERCFESYYLIIPTQSIANNSVSLFCGPTKAYPMEIRLVGYGN